MNEKKGEVILIVDDDPYTLESISSLLNEHGYSVVACGNAADAMAKIQKNRIDIVLTDIRMPVVSGIELLEKIHSFNSEIPVILITAYAELDMAIDAIRRGAFDFITKPYSPEYLVHAVERAIEHNRYVRLEKEFKCMLQDSVKEKTEKLNEIEVLAAGIAHEIRNPIGNVKAAAQLCFKKYDPDERLRTYLKIIIKNTEKVNRVIKDLLNLAKPHKALFKRGSIDKVINNLCDLVKAKCSKQKVLLIKRSSRRLPEISLDERLLEEAFLNLILNALDAMPKGGRLAITTYYDYNAREIVISFIDSGSGISEDNQGRIFYPFFTTKKNGTGLGLSLALQIIELHKGKIHIESKLDYGTEVTVRLPAYKG
jgi:signal transduction histidine kinase